MDGPARAHHRQRVATTVYTVGHGTRPVEELIELLRAFQVEVLCDTRSFPRSRRNPQFNTENLAVVLPEHGIAYQHWPLLGGRRPTRPDSPNTAWRNEAFRGYADYMQTPPFEEGIRELEALAAQRVCAVMCAESVWWRCHRRMIADRLTVDGFRVLHILTPGHEPRPHIPSPGLTVEDGRIVYRAAQPSLPL